ncbi:unnamed protein product [Prunus brigantina]
MTGPTPPSFPTPSPTSAGNGVAGKCRKPIDFRRKFPSLVLRRPAAIFGDQDLSKIGHRNDQFVMASQVKQVFYLDDPMHHGWSVVL